MKVGKKIEKAEDFIINYLSDKSTPQQPIVIYYEYLSEVRGEDVQLHKCQFADVIRAMERNGFIHSIKGGKYRVAE